MKLYIYRDLDDEKVPKDVTHVIVDNSVTAIKKMAFFRCEHLVSIIMVDNVKRIESSAFECCNALRFIRLSKALEYSGYDVFLYCRSLEALFLSSTVKSIEDYAFWQCQALRLMIIPDNIDLNKVGGSIIRNTSIQQIAENAGVKYDYKRSTFVESTRRVNEWLAHHMDEAPFHKLCYNSFITTKQLNEYLGERGNDLALSIDPIHGMTPMHMLSMNPHSTADAIAALLDVNMEAAFRLDNGGKISLDYVRDCNVGGLVAAITSLLSSQKCSLRIHQK